MCKDDNISLFKTLHSSYLKYKKLKKSFVRQSASACTVDWITCFKRKLPKLVETHFKVQSNLFQKVCKNNCWKFVGQVIINLKFIYSNKGLSTIFDHQRLIFLLYIWYFLKFDISDIWYFFIFGISIFMKTNINCVKNLFESHLSNIWL